MHIYEGYSTLRTCDDVWSANTLVLIHFYTTEVVKRVERKKKIKKHRDEIFLDENAKFFLDENDIFFFYGKIGLLM